MQFFRLKTFIFSIITAVLFGATNSPARADDYKKGLKAYVDGEFTLAQRHWLVAANAKDGKSMFNLGLLHEQNKLDSASIEKALNWYRLAAENGYPPAGYHLAQRMLERGGSDDDAIVLIRRAADTGYAPAKRYLGLGDKPVSREQVAKLDDFRATNTESLDDKPVQSEHWINRQRGQNWTIQLLAFKQKQQVLAFVKEHGLQRNAAYFSETKGTDVFYKLVYGSFDSKDKADFARQNLSPELRQHGPWLRTLASIQEVTRQ